MPQQELRDAGCVINESFFVWLVAVSFFSLDHCVTVVGQKLRRKKGTAGDDRYSVTGIAFCLLSRTTAQTTLDAFVSAAGLTQTL